MYYDVRGIFVSFLLIYRLIIFFSEKSNVLIALWNGYSNLIRVFYLLITLLQLNINFNINISNIYRYYTLHLKSKRKDLFKKFFTWRII